MESKEAANIIRFNLIDRGGCDSFSSKEIEALNMSAAAFEAKNRLTEMLNKQIDAYAEQHKGRDLSDLEYGRITAYEHCLEVLEDD